MIRLSAFTAVAALGLAGCSATSGNNTAQLPVTSVNPAVQSSNLQFAVGTANIGGTATGMNVVVTNRAGSGTSAVLVSTPFLSGPMTLPATAGTADANGSTIKTGPSAAEIAGTIPGCGAPCIAGTPQQAPGQPVALFPYTSTFGTSGGVFGLGFAPANATQLPNTSAQYTPYGVPVYGTSLFTPWGGPPAYDPAKDGKGTRDGTFGDYTVGVLGTPLGLNVFNGVGVGAGAYTLNLQIPTAGGVTGPAPAAFSLAGVTTLPTIAAPVISVDTSGNITASAVLPSPQFVGGYIELVTTGKAACNGAGDLTKYGSLTPTNPSSSPRTTVYYTQWFTGTAGTIAVGSANAPGPPGSAFPAVCSGDTVTGYVIGFDYNHYNLTYNGPSNSAYSVKPTLPASADISISPAGKFVAP